jgi:hypothetical protein
MIQHCYLDHVTLTKRIDFLYREGLVTDLWVAEVIN